MTTPLTTWYCDVCGEKIEDAKKGYVIWRTDTKLKTHDFKIIHQKKCDQKDHMASGALRDFLGEEGLAHLLAKISLGPVMLKCGQKSYCQVKDLDEFVDFFRRVQTPYYEEARREFSTPEFQNDFSDANEVYPYLPKTLKKIASKY